MREQVSWLQGQGQVQKLARGWGLYDFLVSATWATNSSSLRRAKDDPLLDRRKSALYPPLMPYLALSFDLTALVNDLVNAS